MDHILDIIRKFNRILRDYLREYMLDAVAFRTPEVRERMKEDPYIEKLGFGLDTALREKIKEQFVNLPPILKFFYLDSVRANSIPSHTCTMNRAIQNHQG